MSGDNPRRLRILGSRGIPAAYGGFETSAEQIAVYLTARGWQVTVYCQAPAGTRRHEDVWNGIKRVHIAERTTGSLGSLMFDLESTVHAIRARELVYTLGYNTAIFFLLYRLSGVRNIVNTDGFEWMRTKWPTPVRWWLRLNQWLAAKLASHVVADHPEMRRYLSRLTALDRISMLTYSAPFIRESVDGILAQYGLPEDNFCLVVARPDPDNSPLEIVLACSRRRRNRKLVMLGNLIKGYPYHDRVLASASDEIIFAGAIHDHKIVSTLRLKADFYIHGHQRGGVNPSLVEAMSAGTPCIAYDNVFNRWTAGDAAVYFKTIDELDQRIDTLSNDMTLRERLSAAGRRRHAEEFTEERVLPQYEQLFLRWLGPPH
jgi:glycosyltransferase involved in cell wall biosynthesis